MAFLRSTSCGGDEVMRRHIAGQIVELAEKYAPDTAWYIHIMAEVGMLCNTTSALVRAYAPALCLWVIALPLLPAVRVRVGAAPK